MLESVGFEFGFMTGPQSWGPKPHRMAQVLPELHALARRLVRKKAACLSKTQRIGITGLLLQDLGGGGTVGVRYSGSSTPIPGRAALDAQSQLSGAPSAYWVEVTRRWRWKPRNAH